MLTDHFRTLRGPVGGVIMVVVALGFALDRVLVRIIGTTWAWTMLDVTIARLLLVPAVALLEHRN